MFNVDFYNFIKDENSTKRPTGSPDTFQCQMKRPGSLIAPTIELNIGLASAPSWNYCYISDFSRYYFIADWTWESGFWTASLRCDALATYRTEIGDADLYCLRAANLYDGTIVDNMYPTKTGCQFSTEVLPAIWEPVNVNTGIFVMGTVSAKGDYGGLKYYAMTATEANIMSEYLASDLLMSDNSFDLTNAAYALQKSLVDPMQFIKSCVYIPVNSQDLVDAGIIGTTGEDLIIFDWPVRYIIPGPPPTSGAVVQTRSLAPDKPAYTFTKQITIPKHPQASSRGIYTNLAPYTTLALHIPPFGTIEIDTTVAANASTLDIEIAVDLPTGLGILDIKCNGMLLNSISAQIGVPVQLSQVTRDYFGGITSSIGGVGATLMNAVVGNLGGAIMSAASCIGDAQSAMNPRASTLGTGGSYAQLYTEVPRLDAQFFIIADDDITKNGRPCCQVVKPKNVTGYMLIQDGDIPMGGTHEEAQIVKGYLEGGFYWE